MKNSLLLVTRVVRSFASRMLWLVNKPLRRHLALEYLLPEIF